MVVFLGAVRCNLAMTCFAPYRCQIYNSSPSISFYKNGFAPIRHVLHASLHSSPATAEPTSEVSAGQSEIIFMGTGTSEGIPRVSCLTDPNKKCPVKYAGKPLNQGVKIGDVTQASLFVMLNQLGEVIFSLMLASFFTTVH